MLLALIATATVGQANGDLYGPLPAGPAVAPGDARGLALDGLDPEDVALFVPRAILLPLHYALVVTFWPIEQLLTVVDQYEIVEHVEDLLYNDARTAGVLPIFVAYPGQGPSGGLKLFHHDAFGHQEKVSASGRFGGIYEQGYAVELEADRLGGTPLWTELELRFDRKPHLHFLGIGSELGPETFFSQARVLGRFRIGHDFGEPTERLRIGTSVLYNHRRFGSGHRLGSDHSIETAYDTSKIVGFEQGVDLVELTADFVLDFRSSEGLTPTGFFIEAFAGGAPPQGSYRFFHYGAEAFVFIDLLHQTRILALRAGIEAVEAGDGRIPFSELPRLGGPRRLRGYALDALRDEKAIFASIEYRWPVHANLEAHAFLDMGSVGHDYTALFDRVRFGGGGGLVIGSVDSFTLALDVAYGDGVQLFLATDIFRAFAKRTEEL